MTPRRYMSGLRRFERTHCLQVKESKNSQHGINAVCFKMQAIRSFETSDTTQQTSPCHITEGPNPQIYRCEKLKSRIIRYIFSCIPPYTITSVSNKVQILMAFILTTNPFLYEAVYGIYITG
jgi:hypothetical protein